MTDRLYLQLNDKWALGADNLQWILYRVHFKRVTTRLDDVLCRQGRQPGNKHQWKGKTIDAIGEWKRDQAAAKKRQRERPKKQNPGATSRTTVVRLCELRNANVGKTP